MIIIAEIGENHIGDMDIARRLIKDASEAGATYVKFQSYKPETFRTDDPEYAWFKKVHLSDEAHFMLKRYSDDLGIKFLSSPFSVERAAFLCEDLGLKEFKIASGVMLNFLLLDYLNKHADTIFLSTGMASIDEIISALSHLKDVKKCYILHCTTQYPCKDKEANLLAIKTLKERFSGYDVGYSDHTMGYLAAVIAVSLGAKVIEKHFTFDKNAKEGTDHIISVDRGELKKMIADIARVEKLLGDPGKSPTIGEKEIISFVRNRFEG